MRKLAVIRSDSDTPCPYGLHVNFGCQNAGKTVLTMYPINEDASDEDKQKTAASNKKMMVWSLMMSGEKPKQCVYAANLFPNKPDKVDCSYGDTAAGEQAASLIGSPAYADLFSGIDSPLYSLPLNNFTDSNMKNSYYGIYSIQGSEKIDLVKLAKYLFDRREFQKITKT